jgi:hypothetical protein
MLLTVNGHTHGNVKTATTKHAKWARCCNCKRQMSSDTKIHLTDCDYMQIYRKGSHGEIFFTTGYCIVTILRNKQDKVSSI